MVLAKIENTVVVNAITVYLHFFKTSLDEPLDVHLCSYEGGSESSVIGVITLLIDIIGCCIIP